MARLIKAQLVIDNDALWGANCSSSFTGLTMSDRIKSQMMNALTSNQIAGIGGGEIILLFVILLPIAFWIWMLVDCVKREPAKVAWILVIALGWCPGALIYFFARKLFRRDPAGWLRTSALSGPEIEGLNLLMLMGGGGALFVGLVLVWAAHKKSDPQAPSAPQWPLSSIANPSPTTSAATNQVGYLLERVKKADAGHSPQFENAIETIKPARGRVEDATGALVEAYKALAESVNGKPAERAGTDAANLRKKAAGLEQALDDYEKVYDTALPQLFLTATQIEENRRGFKSVRALAALANHVANCGENLSVTPSEKDSNRFAEAANAFVKAFNEIVLGGQQTKATLDKSLPP